MTPHDYDYLRNLVKVRSGLVLGADKHYLVESRLLPVARKAGLADLTALVQKLKSPDGGPLVLQVIEAMMTNETFFFRDRIPFEQFRDTIMPALLAARATERRIRIWCAAASTGQEPYTLAICLKEMGRKLAGWQIDILATDISNEALEKARSGTYTQFEVQRGLPIMMLVKYFTQTGELWQLTPEVRSMVQFKVHNLLHDFGRLGVFDVVFCRNVLMYFDQQTKVEVLNRLARVIAADGFLLLGAAETVVGLTDAFKPVADKRGLYVPQRPAVPKSNVIDLAATRAAMAGAR
ncbi:MAG TPA: protein-glutamate O-methyltransferase CheR [Xanthobacteraceae bacterium]|nr:protein-glutamate O-methyltransferase CheR [Xanthobacteraceae bacterium]